MILVMLRVMALSLWRDRAGLVLVFVLPPLVFIVFASVFSSGASGRLDIRAGVVDLTDSADSRRLLDSLQRRLGGRLTRLPYRIDFRCRFAVRERFRSFACERPTSVASSGL